MDEEAYGGHNYETYNGEDDESTLPSEQAEEYGDGKTDSFSTGEANSLYRFWNFF